MQTIRIKRGDTLSLSCAALAAGVAVNLSTTTITSMVRSSAGVLILTPTVTVTDAAAGTFTVSATATVTKDLVPGSYVCDIQYSEAGGTVYSTETFGILVIADVTYPEPDGP